MNLDNATVCKGCGVIVSKKRYFKHKEKGRCAAQHMRLKDKRRFGKKGK